MGYFSSMVLKLVLVVGLLSCVSSLYGPTVDDLEVGSDKLLVVHYDYTDKSLRNQSVADISDERGCYSGIRCIKLDSPEDGKYSSHLCKSDSPRVFLITYANGEQRKIVVNEYERRISPFKTPVYDEKAVNAKLEKNGEILACHDEESTLCKLIKLVKLDYAAYELPSTDMVKMKQELIDGIDQGLDRMDNYLTLSLGTDR